MTDHYQRISGKLGIRVNQVQSVVELLDEGATVPFISRYRKERTGSLDEVAITAIRDQIEQLRELDKRRKSILKSIEDQGLLTTELASKIAHAESLSELEDIYLPYKPKKRTRATIAKEKGLEPLASFLFKQASGNLNQTAQNYVDPKKEVLSIDDALQGARDIIAEWINEDQNARNRVRQLFIKKGVITSKVFKGKEEEGEKFKDYFEWSEEVSRIPSHRLLALRRGEKEKVLSLNISPEELDAILLLEKQFVKTHDALGEQVKMACKDSYKRLLKPSMETEVRLLSKTKADTEAIKVFAENLRPLLLAPPLGQKNVMSIDPGFRTGCKVVCLDRQGKLLHFEAIYPNEPQKETIRSAETIKKLVREFNIEAIAIGNGTASRETEHFVNSVGLSQEVIVAMVNESGASIYSASEVAREEFPDQDVTVRGAVSIGRRLMDPLAELVKIDPKSIGIGQYQHDVDQNLLKTSLDDVVSSCVNSVGVELNTSSKQLLTYVSGLGPQLAQNIVDFRNENGAFQTREDLKNVPRLGGKAYEQAAGFLRINNAHNLLDNTAVHPERYDIVKKMASDVGSTINDLIQDRSKREAVNLNNYVSQEVGLPTLEDIMSELDKPGRDPREAFETFQFEEGVKGIEDIKVGMKLPGIVTNVTKFGAFVDIGVHQDGLVHISQLADRFVSDPNEVVTINQKVEPTVTEVDASRKRISLSLKSNPFEKQSPKKKPVKTKSVRSPRNEESMEDRLKLLQNKFK